MAEPSRSQNPPHSTQTSGLHDRKRGAVEDSEDLDAKRIRRRKNYNISADLQAIVNRVYAKETSSKYTELKKNLQSLDEAVKHEEKLSGELKGIIQRYISLNNNSELRNCTLLQLARSYQSHQKDVKRLQYMSIELKELDNKEIADLVQMYIGWEGRNVRYRGRKLYERSDHNQKPGDLGSNSALASALTQGSQNETNVQTPDAKRIQALLDGIWLVESADDITPLPEILKYIHERNSLDKIPMKIDVELFQYHIKLEGEHEQWGQRLLSITQEHAKSTPDQQLLPYEFTKGLLEKAKHYGNQLEEFKKILPGLRVDENRQIADHMKRYVAMSIRAARQSARGREGKHHVVSSRSEHLRSAAAMEHDAFKKAQQELEEIKMFIAPNPKSVEALTFAQIVRAREEIEEHLARKHAGMQAQEQLAFMDETATLVDKHNSLCKKFKKDCPGKVEEFKYSLEELDTVTLWKRK